MRTIRRNNFGGISTNVRPGTILFIHIEDELKLIERKETKGRGEGRDYLQGLGLFDSASYDAKENIDGEVACIRQQKRQQTADRLSELFPCKLREGPFGTRSALERRSLFRFILSQNV